MQEYVKISTDKQTTELLNQVSEAIEYAIESSIVENLNKGEIAEKLTTVIKNQNEFPNFVERIKEQLIKSNTKVEEVSEHNLTQITLKNEVNRNIIIDEIVTLFEKINNQDKTLVDIHSLQKEIEENSKPITEIKERAISNFDNLSKNLDEIKIVSSDSSQKLNEVAKELADIKEQITLNNNEIKKSINLILSKQDSTIEKIKTIETIQNKPWYKKIFK